MMKKIFLIALLISTVVFASFCTEDFVNYYNKKTNWNSGVVGEGTLVINTKVILNNHVRLPADVKVSITMHGELNTNNKTFQIGNIIDLATPPEEPVKIFQEKVQVMMTIINSILFD